MSFHRLYGLDTTISIDPNRSGHKHAVDVSIRNGELDFSSSFEVYHDEKIKILRRDSSRDILIKWKGWGGFRVHNGQDIIVQPEKKDLQSLYPVLLGPIFAILLHQRGYLVLHASAVVQDHKATAFLGHSGYGKSTIAAAMNRWGYPFITDDILAVKFDTNSNPYVYPGPPLIKLSPEFLFPDEDSHDMMIYPGEDDRISFIPQFFTDKPVRLSKLYFLKEGLSIEKQGIKNQEALMSLIENSYCNILFSEDEKSHNLNLCSTLLKQVSKKKLYLNYSLDGISQILPII